jgi:Fur family ferric uptake transcriptional regulator
MEAIEVLNQHKLRVTNTRLLVLNFLMAQQKAFSHADLEAKFSNQINRVSIYRVLYTLLARKILCKFVDSNARVLYVFSAHSQHRDEHPHFKCNLCDQVIHLPQLPEDYIALLREHQVEQLHLLVEGVCKDCLGDEKIKK